MTLLFRELLEKLEGLDEVSLVELLDISSEDLVERFEDIIEDKQEAIRVYYGETASSVNEE